MYSSIPLSLLLILLSSLSIGADSYRPQASGSFIDYCNQLPTLALPLEMHCGFNGPYLDETKLDSQLVASFGPQERKLAGRLPCPNGGVVPILYCTVGDMLYPYLYTFDSRGRIIDSLYLHLYMLCYFCDGDEQGRCSAFARIKPDLSIVMADTSLAYTLSPGGQPAEGPDTLSVLIRQYQIDSAGHFVVQWDSTKKFLVPHVPDER